MMVRTRALTALQVLASPANQAFAGEGGETPRAGGRSRKAAEALARGGAIRGALEAPEQGSIAIVGAGMSGPCSDGRTQPSNSPGCRARSRSVQAEFDAGAALGRGMASQDRS
jgi:hypothetical protein